MTTEPLPPLEEEPDQHVEERYPDGAEPAETPDDDGQRADPAVPPPEPTNG